jgi:anti-sigma regulatory factor (Ser/Thr protein kinase)
MPVNRSHNIISFTDRVGSEAHRSFMLVANEIMERGFEDVILDFSKCASAYLDGMVPVICVIDHLKSRGVEFSLQLPEETWLARLFVNTNWAHFICPDKYKQSDIVHDRHLALQRFEDFRQQQQVVNYFLDVVMRSMMLDRRIISGLEWSINEITDNVLNHAQSDNGGFIQVMTNQDKGTIFFIVGDPGRGILAAMKEGFPTMTDDAYAIGEAVKAGVTSRRDYGQGNGLAGTLRIATWSRGLFEITSGSVQLVVKHDGSDSYEGAESRIYRRSVNQIFQGTIVSATIGINSVFSLEEALGFGKALHQPTDIIELQYENDEGTEMYLKLCDETTGFGTRFSGSQIRTKVSNLLSAGSGKILVIDWDGIPVVSSSFADEFVGKIFVDLGPLNFSMRVRNVNMEALVKGLVDKAIKQRLVQSMSSDGVA